MLKKKKYDKLKLKKFVDDLMYWTGKENLPPEFSNHPNYPTPEVAIDIWGLGKLLSTLVNLHENKGNYSSDLLKLQAALLNLDPNIRPRTNFILRYIMAMQSVIKKSPFEIVLSSLTKIKGKSKTSFNLGEEFSELINNTGTKYI